MPGVLEPPTATQFAAIRTALGMEPERARQAVGQLRDWLRAQPHLPAAANDLEDAWLERYLSFCKNSVERAKKSLDFYFTARGAIPELYSDRDPLSPALQENMDALYVMPLPRLTPEGHRVHLYAHADPDPARYSPLHFMKRTVMIADIRLQEEQACLGDIIVFDLKDSRLGHLAKLNPTLLRKFLVCMQSAYPIRVAQVHFINAPAFTDKILAMARPFIKEKLRQRITVHTNGTGTLLEHVPVSVLPAEYGGDAGSLQQLNAAWREKLYSCRDWLLSLETLKSDESKRVGDAEHGEELFGCAGSFRQLTVD